MKSGFPLLFDWPSRHAVHLALPAMIVVSLLAHAAGIAAFSLAPPRAEADLRHAEVFLLRPTPDSGNGYQPSMEAADPSLYSPAASEARGLWNIRPTEYTPEYDRAGGIPNIIRFRGLPETPSAQDHFPPPGPVPVERPRPTAVSPLAGNDSEVVFGGDFGRFSLPFPVAPAPGETLAPAEFFVVSGSDGRILHAVLLATSGSETADAAAGRFLLQTRLRPPGREISGTASVLWGNGGNKKR